MYKDFILLVDSHRPEKRSTSGRYRVCAKNEKQAIELLKTKISTGKISVFTHTDTATLPKKHIRKE